MQYSFGILKACWSTLGRFCWWHLKSYQKMPQPTVGHQPESCQRQPAANKAIDRKVRWSRNFFHSLLSIWRWLGVEVRWSMSWGRRWFHGKFLWKYNMNKLLVEKYGTRLHVHTLLLQSGGGGGRDAKATKLTLRIVVFWVERISCLSPVCRMRICAWLDPVCCRLR